MTRGGTDALEQAIALYRAPGRLPLLHERPLPTAVLLLLRIVANDRVALETATHTTGETPDTLVDAAILYIQQVLFAATSDAYRLLGVHPDAPNAQIKDHYRWLMRWLHPDRQSERWEVVYSDRVNRAWQALRPDRRDSYVSAPLDEADSAPWEPTQRNRAMRLTPAPVAVARPLLSARMTTRLPILVLGGLALTAVAMVALLYVTQQEIPAFDPQPDAEQAAVHAQLPQAIPSSDQVLADVREQALARKTKAAARAPIQPKGSPASAVVRGMSLPAVAASTTTRPPPRSSAPPLATVRAAPIASSPQVKRQSDVPLQPDSGRKSRDRKESRQDLQNTVAATANASATDADSPHRASTAASADTAVESSQNATRSISRSFARAYASGDLPTMMQLFSVDAVSNRGGVQAIAEDYNHLFSTTLSRQLKLDRLAWTTSADRIIGSGPFEAIIQRKQDAPAETVRGWLTIEATVDDGEWRIKRIMHKSAP